jgi:hypothetical protein
MPPDMATAVAVFAAMPDELDGRARETSDYELEARYGTAGIMAVQLVGEPGAAEAMMTDNAAHFSDVPGGAIEASQLDPASGLMYAIGSFTDQGDAGAVNIAGWCEPDGAFFFSADGDSPEMRDAVIEAFVAAGEAVAEAGTPEPSEALIRLEELGAAVPSASELESFMGVQGLSVDTFGGPGVAGFMFEHADLTNLIGGYQLMFRSLTGGADTGWLNVVLFDTEADAAAVMAEMWAGEDPEADRLIRSEFDVTDLLTDGEGAVQDPEPDSHFTTIVGYSGPIVVSFLVFHGPDDDRIEAARSVVYEVAEWLEGLGL